MDTPVVERRRVVIEYEIKVPNIQPPTEAERRRDEEDFERRVTRAMNKALIRNGT